MRCGRCKELKESTRVRQDPFQKEIWGKDVKRPFCDECYQECLWDI